MKKSLVAVGLSALFIMLLGATVIAEGIIQPQGFAGIYKIWVSVLNPSDGLKAAVESKIANSNFGVTVTALASDADCLLSISALGESVIVEALRPVKLTKGNDLQEFWTPIYRREIQRVTSADAVISILDDFLLNVALYSNPWVTR